MTLRQSIAMALFGAALGVLACSTNAARSTPEAAGDSDWTSVPVHPSPVPEIEEDRATVKPRLVKPGKPTYPISLASEGIDGRVRLRYIVTEDGLAFPQSIQVVASTHPAFNAAAKETVRTGRFAPGQLDGYRVRVW